MYLCSYGLNQYCSSETGGGRTWDELIPNAIVKNPDRVPIMGDGASSGDTPQEMDIPPEFDGQIYYEDGSNQNEIRSFCINRHNFAINMLFLDSSVRDVGLKELWTLRWHRQFDTEGPWTAAGGVQSTDWPEWMRNFKDY